MFLKVNDHNMHISLHGSQTNPPLMLLHSLGGSGEIWENQIRHLSERHFVVCPDFRGHGLSEMSREPVTIELLADDIAKIVTAIGIGHFHMAGISIGGLVAQLVAGKLHGTVRTLTLLDSNIVSLAPQMWRDRAAQVRFNGLHSISEAVLSRWTTPNGRKTPEGRGLEVMFGRTPSDGYAAGCDALATADCRENATKLTMPTTVAVGEFDEATPVAASQALVSAIPGATLHVIPDAAHIPLLEKADAVNRLLDAAISRG